MCSSSARLEAIWSMMPQLTPAYWISACCAICASVTLSSCSLSSVRSARSVATSSAADDDRPVPSARLDRTYTRSGGTFAPRSSSSRMQPSI